MADGGKGSRPRPFSVDQKTFDSNWENIFRKDKKEHSGVEEKNIQQTEKRITDHSSEDQ